MAATISDATLNKDIRASFLNRGWANTQLCNGVYGAIRPKIRSHLGRTLTKSRMLAKYVRNSPQDRFTATDVAMVDYIQDLHDDDSLQERIMSKPWYCFKYLRDRQREYNRKGKRKINNAGPVNNEYARPRPINYPGPSRQPTILRPRPARAINNSVAGPVNNAAGPVNIAAGPVNDPARRARRRSTMNDFVDMTGHYKVNIRGRGNCLFNSLAVAARYVELNGAFDGRSLSLDEQDRLGLDARQKIVQFLDDHRNEYVPARRGQPHRWEREYRDMIDPHYHAALPPSERSYERFLQYMSQPGIWGNDLCLLAGHQCLLDRPFMAAQVREITPNVYISIAM